MTAEITIDHEGRISALEAELAAVRDSMERIEEGQQKLVLALEPISVAFQRTKGGIALLSGLFVAAAAAISNIDTLLAAVEKILGKH